MENLVDFRLKFVWSFVWSLFGASWFLVKYTLVINRKLVYKNESHVELNIDSIWFNHLKLYWCLAFKRYINLYKALLNLFSFKTNLLQKAIIRSFTRISSGNRPSSLSNHFQTFKTDTPYVIQELNLNITVLYLRLGKNL
jgi:hypothetical protein